MRLRLPAVLAIALLAGACIEGLERPNGRFGTIAAPAWSDGGGGYVLAPEAAFYDQTDLSYEPFIGDTCVLLPYSPIVQVNSGLLTLNAGNYLFTYVGTRIDTLAPLPSTSIRVYAPLRTNGIPFTPGDTLEITVPGHPNGFPQSAVSVRTAEPFTHGAIPVPAEDVGIDLTWTAATSPGSQMTFSLRYRNASATTAQNEQVFCSFNDDGGATIPSGYLTGWRNSVGGDRSTRAIRVRHNQVDVDSRTTLSIISSYGQPLLEYDPGTLPTIRAK